MSHTVSPGFSPELDIGHPISRRQRIRFSKQFIPVEKHKNSIKYLLFLRVEVHFFRRKKEENENELQMEQQKTINIQSMKTFPLQDAK